MQPPMQFYTNNNTVGVVSAHQHKYNARPCCMTGTLEIDELPNERFQMVNGSPYLTVALVYSHIMWIPVGQIGHAMQ